MSGRSLRSLASSSHNPLNARRKMQIRSTTILRYLTSPIFHSPSLRSSKHSGRTLLNCQASGLDDSTYTVQIERYVLSEQTVTSWLADNLGDGLRLGTVLGPRHPTLHPEGLAGITALHRSGCDGVTALCESHIFSGRPN